MDCIFCKISRKEIPSDVVYENENVFGFLDAHPIAPGHSLVIPKEHSETISDCSAESITSVFLGVQAVVRRLKEVLNPDGFTIGINHGEAAGQAVPHFHIHVIPRWKEDGGGALVHGIVKNSRMSYDAVKQKVIINRKS